MVESRCGILCKECEFQEKVGCRGCVHIDKPFWGTCDVKSCCELKGLEHCGKCWDFPCEVAKDYAYDECQGDGGKRLEQCRKWCELTCGKCGNKAESTVDEENDMNRFKERGYYVVENGPVYFTLDMDKTAKWFEEVLGWYSEIDERNEEGKGCYGCVYSLPTEIEVTHLAPFTGIHMFYGEPRPEMICFMKVKGIEKMREYILAKGWEQITEVVVQPWGGKTCAITTVDGCMINVFE